MEITKRCGNPECLEPDQPLDQFCKDKKRRDGLSVYCRRCRNARVATWKQANPGLAGAANKRHKQSHPEASARYSQEYRARHPDRVVEARRRQELARYGLTPESYAVLLAAQGGGCAICGSTCPGGAGRFHIDHDHSCCGAGRKACDRCRRGLLCHHCNLMLGNAKEKADVLTAAVAYLTAYQLG